MKKRVKREKERYIKNGDNLHETKNYLFIQHILSFCAIGGTAPCGPGSHEHHEQDASAAAGHLVLSRLIRLAIECAQARSLAGTKHVLHNILKNTAIPKWP